MDVVAGRRADRQHRAEAGCAGGSPQVLESQDLELDLGLMPAAHRLQTLLLVLLGQRTPGVAPFDARGLHEVFPSVVFPPPWRARPSWNIPLGACLESTGRSLSRRGRGPRLTFVEALTEPAADLLGRQ